MQLELEALAPRLVVSTRETEELLVVIEKQTVEADKVKAVVQVRAGVGHLSVCQGHVGCCYGY